MIEIRFHGRGGQGTVVATILLAKAFFEAGWQVQSFPFFGVERRGAPVEAYVRLDREKILLRTNVTTPDHVAVQDQTLLHSINVTRGLKPGGWILVNSPSPPADLTPYAGFQLAHVDAKQIALNHRLGTRTHPIVNTGPSQVCWECRPWMPLPLQSGKISQPRRKKTSRRPATLTGRSACWE
jgi:2-oxoacid:acceptor oxidoreductase gamma subunit (pyruvate/2-ketoisovalerate family)